MTDTAIHIAEVGVLCCYHLSNWPHS